MDILKFSKEHNLFRERLKAFLETEVTPHVAQWEKDHIVPKSAWKKMGKAGFLCPTVASKYGGLGGDFLYSIIVAEELSYAAHSGLSANVHNDVVPYLDFFGKRAKKNTFPDVCPGISSLLLP